MNLFPGVGVLANVAGIVAGGCAGLVFGRFLTERLQRTLTAACAVTVMFLGLGGALSEALSLGADGRLVFSGSGMLLAAMIGGALIGEVINLEDHMEQFGRFLRNRTRSQGDPRFVEGFVRRRSRSASARWRSSAPSTTGCSLIRQCSLLSPYSMPSSSWS